MSEIIIAGRKVGDDHYVYIHSSPDGVPFYVGKGTGKRASQLRSASTKAWHALRKLRTGTT